MALSSSRLATALETGIRSATSLGSTPYPKLTAYCQAVATAIIDEFKNNAVVPATWTGGTFSGTVAGASSTTPIGTQTNISGTIT